MGDDLDRLEVLLSKRLKLRAAKPASIRDPSAVAAAAIDQRRASGQGSVQMLSWAVAFVAVVAVSLSLLRTPGPPAPDPSITSGAQMGSVAPHEASPPNAQSLGGISVELPVGWRVEKRPAIASTSSLLGYLTMVDVGEPCSLNGSTETCDLAPYKLDEDTAVITVRTGGSPGSDPIASPPTGALAMTIDGMPAYRFEEASQDSEADRVVTWVVATPGTIRSYYSLRAEVRGPSLSALTSVVDDIVGSLRFAVKVTPLATDDSERDKAAAAGLAALERQSTAYACVPRTAGDVGHATIASLPQLPPSDGTIEATCSYSIEPSSRQLWRMVVRFEWDAADDRPSGALDVVTWLSPDGSVVGTETSFGQ